MSRSFRKAIARFLPALPVVALGIWGAGGCGGEAAPIDRIVFESAGALDGSDAANVNETGNIWIMNADGTERMPLTFLTADGADSTGAVWSPDGKKILFSSNRALDGSDAANVNETSNVWIMSADGGDAKPLTQLTAADTFTFASNWSPDGKQVLFTSFRALDGSDAAIAAGNIWIMDADGSDQRPLTELTADKVAGSVPTWSPDGAKIVFSSTSALDGSDALNGEDSSPFGVGNLWVVNADGSDRHPLTGLTVGGFSTHFFHSWSPDGSKIVFHSTRNLDGSDSENPGFSENIWVMNADGSDPVPLTNYTASGSINGPRFSPDGTKIAFNSTYDLSGSDASSPNSDYNLWVMNADGSDRRPLSRLTVEGGLGSFRDWSPDSTRILFVSLGLLDGSDAVFPESLYNLWVADVADGSLVPLTEFTDVKADNFSGDWLPF
ncbi:MAG TPA: hypothetical protein VFX30_08630 [bacterium]|nr:hypothetical protein [bacterium]